MEQIKKNDPRLFSRQIGEKEKRKYSAIHDNKSSVWFGLGMMGIIGWSIAVPTLLGAALGMWLDRKYPESFSWTLTFLIIGLIGGCFIAWHWIGKEHKEMNQKKEEKDD